MTSTEPTTAVRTPAVTVLLAAIADIIAIGVFVAIGRNNHDEAASISGFLSTLWPFLAGAAVGWCVTVVATGPRFSPTRIVPAGVIVWIATVVVGMVVRVFVGQGTATSFIIVATIATAVLLLGWRAVAAIVARTRR